MKKKTQIVREIGQETFSYFAILPKATEGCTA